MLGVVAKYVINITPLFKGSCSLSFASWGWKEGAKCHELGKIVGPRKRTLRVVITLAAMSCAYTPTVSEFLSFWDAVHKLGGHIPCISSLDQLFLPHSALVLLSSQVVVWHYWSKSQFTCWRFQQLYTIRCFCPLCLEFCTFSSRNKNKGNCTSHILVDLISPARSQHVFVVSRSNKILQKLAHICM